MNRNANMVQYNELKKQKYKGINMREILELKARAYDIIGALEQLQADLQRTNAEIAKKIQEQKELEKKYESGDDVDPL